MRAGTTLERDVSHAETEVALRLLGDSRDALLLAVSGLTDADWHTKPSADRWSIAAIVEHLAIFEELFHARIVPRLMESAPRRVLIRPALTNAIHVTADARVLGLARDPRVTIVSPGRASLGIASPPLRPTGLAAPADSLDRLIVAREQSAVFLRSTPDLRQHVCEQPALGPIDGYQWLLYLAAHTERHIAQIERSSSRPSYRAQVAVSDALREVS